MRNPLLTRSLLLTACCCLFLQCQAFQQLRPLIYSSSSASRRAGDSVPGVTSHPLAPPLSQRPVKPSLFLSAKGRSSSDNSSHYHRFRLLRLPKLKLFWRLVATLTLAVSLFLGSPLPAFASTATAAAAAPINSHIAEKVYSIRPGMNQELAELSSKGDIDLQAVQSQLDETRTTAIMDSDSGVAAPIKKKTNSLFGRKDKSAKAKVNSLYGDADEEDDEDFLDDKDILPPSSQANSKNAPTTGGGKSTKSAFAGIDTTPDEHKQKMLTLKIATCLFIPTFGTMWTREFFRRRREEKYVKRGLEIMKAQRAEYFNVTATAEDADVEDELKNLKNGTTSEDDEDDDDDDQPPRPPSRGRPKRPSPRDDGPSSGSGGSDLGYGKASNADIDKLKNLFNKS